MTDPTAENKFCSPSRRAKLATESRGMVSGISLIAVLLLAAISIAPGIPGQAALGSLRFHLACAILILPVLLALCGARLRAMVMTALTLASLGQGALIVWNQQETRYGLAALPVVGRFILLNYNVMSGNPIPRDAAQAIIDSSADIAVIMEAHGIADQLARIREVFPYGKGCESPLNCSTMLLSRTPLANAQIYPLGSMQRLRLVIAETTIDGQRVTIAGVHLTKPYFDDYAWGELYQVRRALSKLDGPVVLSGDFNAAAWSSSISNLVTQARLVPPPNYPATWPVGAGALGVPIDNMFTSGSALIDVTQSIPEHGSNHRGLLAQITLREPLPQ